MIKEKFFVFFFLFIEDEEKLMDFFFKEVRLCIYMRVRMEWDMRVARIWLKVLLDGI